MSDVALDILFLLETHLTYEKSVELREQFVDFDIFEKQRKNKKGKKHYRFRGGVVCITRKGFAEELKTKTDDLLGIKFCNLNIFGVYFVPSNAFCEEKRKENAGITTTHFEVNTGTRTSPH